MIRTENRVFRIVAKLVSVILANRSMPFGFANTFSP